MERMKNYKFISRVLLLIFIIFIGMPPGRLEIISELEASQYEMEGGGGSYTPPTVLTVPTVPTVPTIPIQPPAAIQGQLAAQQRVNMVNGFIAANGGSRNWQAYLGTPAGINGFEKLILKAYDLMKIERASLLASPQIIQSRVAVHRSELSGMTYEDLNALDYSPLLTERIAIYSEQSRRDRIPESLPVGGTVRPAVTQGRGMPIPCCFPAGTLVSAGDGSEKKIEEVKAGETVLTYDGERKENVPSRVTGLIRPVREGVYRLRLSDRTVIEPTGDHPLYTREGWKAMEPGTSAEGYKGLEGGELSIGDEVLKVDGSYAAVEEAEYMKGEVQTYTLSVAENSSYYANGVLAHNMYTCEDYYGTTRALPVNQFQRQFDTRVTAGGDPLQVSEDLLYSEVVMPELRARGIPELSAMDRTSRIALFNQLVSDGGFASDTAERNYATVSPLVYTAGNQR